MTRFFELETSFAYDLPEILDEFIDEEEGRELDEEEEEVVMMVLGRIEAAVQSEFGTEDGRTIVSANFNVRGLSEDAIDLFSNFLYPTEGASILIRTKLEKKPETIKRMLLDFAIEAELEYDRLRVINHSIYQAYYGIGEVFPGEDFFSMKEVDYRRLQGRLRERFSPAEKPERR